MGNKGVIQKTDANAVDSNTHWAIDAGTGTLGSGTATITSKLSTVTHVGCTLDVAGAPALTTSQFSWTASGGTITVYGWKPTGSGDTTLIAATDADTFSWYAIGT